MARGLSTPRAILLVVGLLVGAVAVGVFASNVRSKARLARVDVTLQTAVAATKNGRIERPVLRGAPVDGNAWEAQKEAVAALAPDKDALKAFGELLKGRDPMPPELLALAAAKAEQLATLRDAARRSWTWNGVDVTRGFGAPIPEYPVHLAATKLLLLLAEQSAPADCLHITADALRLSQDRIPGGGLLPSMVAAAETRLVTRAALRCAGRAVQAERAAAAAEFVTLLDGRPSFAATLELETLVFASELRRQAATPPALTALVDRPAELVERMHLGSAAEHLVGELGKWNAATASGPPASIAATKALVDARLATGNTLLEVATPDLAKYVAKDAEALALLRATILALDAMETIPPRIPARIADATLADPFSGRPFLLHPANARAPARLCSVGPDGVDGIGDPASDDVCLELQ